MIWDPDSGNAEESSLLGCNIVLLHTHPTTQCHIPEDLNLQGKMRSGKLKYLYFILFIPCITVFLQSVYLPTNALDKIQFMTIIKTPTCLGTGVPSAGTYKTKDSYMFGHWGAIRRDL
jgi:hypothetical protein